MAKRINPEVKARLKANGQWAFFLKRREELKKEGFSPDDARAAAILEAEALPVTRAATPAAPKGTPGDQVPGDLEIAPEALAGKAASEPEVARWVFRNVDNPHPDPKSCPDPFAWTLLRMCRTNPAFLLTFVKDVWTKLLVSESKRPDKAIDEEIDGTPTIELIDRIQAMSDEAKAK